MASTSTTVTLLGALCACIITTADLNGQITPEIPPGYQPPAMLSASAADSTAVDSSLGIHVRTNALYFSCPPNTLRAFPLEIYNTDRGHVHAGKVVTPANEWWFDVLGGSFPALGYQLGLETYQIATVKVDSRGLKPGWSTTDIFVNSDDPLHPSIPVHLTIFVGDSLPEQPTHFVVEEGTGTWCGGCPDGARLLDTLKQNVGDRAIILCYHTYDELTVPEAETLLTNELGINGIPTAALMRRPDPRNRYSYFNWSWDVWAQYGLLMRPLAEVALTLPGYSYDRITHRVSATLRMVTNTPIPLPPDTAISVTAFLVEDSIITKQLEHTTDGILIHHDSYAQMNTVRAVFPDRLGSLASFGPERMRDGLLVPRSETSLNFEFDASAITVPRNARVVFVAQLVDTVNRTDKARIHLGEILQGLEVPLAPEEVAAVPGMQTTEREEPAGEIHPNPARSEARISLNMAAAGEASLEVVDARGDLVRRIPLGRLDAGSYERSIPVEGLPEGVYTVIIRAGDQSVVRRMVVVR